MISNNNLPHVNDKKKKERTLIKVVIMSWQITNCQMEKMKNQQMN